MIKRIIKTPDKLGHYTSMQNGKECFIIKKILFGYELIIINIFYNAMIMRFRKINKRKALILLISLINEEIAYND